MMDPMHQEVMPWMAAKRNVTKNMRHTPTKFLGISITESRIK